LRRTTIIPSHFITFTRSSQGKASSSWSGLWLCLFLFVIFSCKDDAAYVGFQKDSRLDARYVDIPLNPSVIQNSGIQTSNMSGDQLFRIAIGRYNDPLFGNIEATGFVNLAPPIVFSSPPADATYDSLVLQLNLDYYYYGQAGTSSTQRIQVYQLLDTMVGNKPYTASSSIAYSSIPLAEQTFTLNTSEFDNALALNADSDTTNNQTLTIQIKIPGSLGPQLFNDLKNDSTLVVTFDQFSGKYKGFALKVPEGDGDKVFGINPVYRDLAPKVTDTKLALYYTQDGVSLHYDFLLAPSSNYVTGLPYPVSSFSRIITDRSATALSGIVPFQEFRPTDNRFYVQGGTSLVTKLDLNNFYKYVDTLDNIVFNSAELVVNNISSSRPPYNLSLRVLDSLNRFRFAYVDTLTNDTIRIVTDPYFLKTKGAFTVNTTVGDQTVNVTTDGSSTISIDPDTRIISQIGITEFCQQIYKHRKDPDRVKAISIAIEEVESKKSVDAVILDSNIKLRVYYTKPIVKIR
jgi:Domain of unknown function (DUF4270)